MDVLLLSTYELGHQPLGVARPAANLAAAGHRVRCQDLAVERLDESLVRQADLVGISVPMHTATRLGMRAAERVRAINPRCHVSFYGLYAAMHADTLLGRLADSVIAGEFETPLEELAEQLGKSAQSPVATSHSPLTYFGRQAFLTPRRDLLPPLDRYARVDTGDERRLVGYVEASRGCAHRCLHCPITPVYRGRLRIVQPEVVLEDIGQLVDMGAQHITFGDPDFFNGIRHSLRIVEAMHREFPWLSFDATIKVEHLLEHRAHLRTLKETGCLFVVSAVEAVQDHILENFQKGHTGADVETALRLMEQVVIPLRPTFVPFTPWTLLGDYLELLNFVERRGLIRHVDPIQFAIRLLVPRGSSLVGTPALDPFLGEFDDATLSHRWRHADLRMEQLHREVTRLVEHAAAIDEAHETTFGRIRELAHSAAGTVAEPMENGRSAKRGHVPRLTEPWFC